MVGDQANAIQNIINEPNFNKAMEKKIGDRNSTVQDEVVSFLHDTLADAIDTQLGKLRDLLSDIVGLTSGLTSGIGALGDVVRDNPATKFLSKAGGSIF